MSDTTYRVAIKYTLDSSEAERGLSRLASSFEGLKSLALGAAAMMGLSEFASKIFEINGQLEKTTITMATMFQAGGFAGLTSSGEDFAKSMGMAKLEIQQMRKDARDLPGTFEDLMAVFKGSLQGGGGAGKSVSQIEKFAAGMMATGTTLGFDSGTIGRDIAMMFQGRVGAHNAMWMQMRRYVKDDKGEQMSDAGFKGLSDTKKWDALQGAVAKFQNGIDAFGKTWDAVSSTTEDYAKQLFQIGTAPVFDFVKGKLEEWNSYYEQNKESIDQMVHSLGVELADAVSKGFSVLKDVFGWIVEHKDALIQVAEAYAAMKVLGGARDLAGIGVGLAGSIGSMAAAGGGGAAGLMASAGASALAFVTAPATIAAVAAAVVGYGGYKLWQAGQDSAANAAAIDPSGVGVDAVERHSDVWGAIRGGDNSVEALMLQNGMMNGDSLNQGKAEAFAERFGNTTEQVNEIMAAFVRVSANIPQHAQMVAELFENASNKLKGPLEDVGEFVKKRLFDGMGIVLGSSQIANPAQALLDKVGKPQKHHSSTQVNVKIVQTIENANDPNRVLVKTREALESIFRNPITTPTSRFAVLR